MEAAGQGCGGLADAVGQEVAVGRGYGVGAESDADGGGRVAGVVEGGAGDGRDAGGDEGVLDRETLAFLVRQQAAELGEGLRSVVGARSVRRTKLSGVGKSARTWAGGSSASSARPEAVRVAGSRTPTSVTSVTGRGGCSFST